jgi:hypothetical protein
MSFEMFEKIEGVPVPELLPKYYRPFGSAQNL